MDSHCHWTRTCCCCLPQLLLQLRTTSSSSVQSLATDAAKTLVQRLFGAGWTIAMHYCMACIWRADASRTIRPERRRVTCNWCAAPWSHHADSTATALVARATTSPFQGRCPGLWQCTDVSGRRLSAHRWHQHAPTPLDRHGDVYALRQSHNTFGDRCFATAAPHPWNSLPSF